MTSLDLALCQGHVQGKEFSRECIIDMLGITRVILPQWDKKSLQEMAQLGLEEQIPTAEGSVCFVYHRGKTLVHMPVAFGPTTILTTFLKEDKWTWEDLYVKITGNAGAVHLGDKNLGHAKDIATQVLLEFWAAIHCIYTMVPIEEKGKSVEENLLLLANGLDPIPTKVSLRPGLIHPQPETLQ